MPPAMVLVLAYVTLMVSIHASAGPHKKIYSQVGLACALIGEAGIRIVGLLWLLSGIGWIFAGIALMFDAAWWYSLMVSVALLSSIVCILASPEAKYGLLINLVILGLVYLNRLYAWLLARKRPLAAIETRLLVAISISTEKV